MKGESTISCSAVIVLLAFSSLCLAGEKQAGDTAVPSLPAAKRNCALCHVSADVKQGSPALKRPVQELCIGCHAERTAPNEHKVNMIPPMRTGKLPLQNGKMTCITCHDPHQNLHGSMLRLPEPDLCGSCHPF